MCGAVEHNSGGASSARELFGSGVSIGFGRNVGVRWGAGDLWVPVERDVDADLPSLTWTRKDPTSGAQLTSYTDINYTEYDPVTKQVYYYVSNAGIFASYAPQTNTVTVLLQGGSYGVPAYSNGVIDPVRRKMVILGAGYAASFDLATGAFSNFSSLTTNCTGIQNPSYPGLAYDPVQDRIVGWAGGNTVYLFDLPSKTCTSVTYPGGPPAQQTNGTYGRWRYFQSLNVFALVNDWKQNAYTLRLTPAP
jgi:hypothetical protein